MKVMFIPDFTEGNPYQRLLRDGLHKEGIAVSVATGVGRLPIRGSVGILGKPDVLHIHWPHGFIVALTSAKTFVKGLRFLLELLLLKVNGVKIVWTVHNLLQHERRHPLLELLFTYVAVRLYDHLIVHCDYAREAVMKTYRLPQRLRKKISVIPHGHYRGCYENSVSRPMARQKLGLEDEEIVFLYIGQIRPYKGVLQLVDTFLNLDVRRARLVVAGKPATGQLKAEVERKAQRDPYVLLKLQFIPDDELQIYLNAADVVVLPYQDSLTSGATVLAMSFGRAVIAPRLGCVAELIEEEKGGFLYDPMEEQGLARAMRKAAAADLLVMGEYNLRKARELDWARIAHATLEVYRRCLA